MDQMEYLKMLEFYRGKRVFVTGHTGFKGSWICQILTNLGAQVTGIALPAPTAPSLFEICKLESKIESVIGDIRNFEFLQKVFARVKPEIVLHLAAQPLVRDSYQIPRETYEINVMGTVNLLECVRCSDTVISFLNVTTDKVYLNRESNQGYTEDQPLDGFDPYSNSKSCSELVTHSYRNSFFQDGPAISTARAGNVIGGGDFAKDRIIPDCVRAVLAQAPIIVRNPNSIRPYQHVIEPLMAYLMIAQRQSENRSYSGYYNVGPDRCDCVKTADLVNSFCQKWGAGAHWIDQSEPNAPHEATFLMLECAHLKEAFGWQPRWGIAEAIEKTVEWTKAWSQGMSPAACMDLQIQAYLKG